MALERVQKLLAQAGIASRRKAEEMIQEGLVTINGKIAQLGDKAEWGKDAIKVKGKLLHTTEAPVYFVFNKPKGVISMLADPEGRPTLADYLDKIHSRIFPIGRLDFNSEGLLLLTNDGNFAEKVQKAETILRVFAVKVKGHPDAEMLSRIEKGGMIGEVRKKRIKPHSVRLLQKFSNKALIEVTLLGSGSTDLKSLFEMKGFLVEKITRTALGHITLKNLLPGRLREITASQAYALIEQPELGMRRHEHAVEAAKPKIRRNVHRKILE